MEEEDRSSHESDLLIPKSTPFNGGETEMAQSFSDQTMELIRASVEKSSFMVTGLIIINRTLFLLFALYVSSVLGVEREWIGYFFCVYGVSSMVLGVWFVWLGEHYGFNAAIVGSFVLPTVGLAIFVVASDSFIMTFVGGVFSAGTTAHTILLQSYTNKLARIAAATEHSTNQREFTREFDTSIAYFKVGALVSTPVIAGELFTVYSTAPFMGALCVSIAVGLFGFTFFVDDYTTILKRIADEDIRIEQIEDDESDDTDTFMLLRVVLLAMLNFFNFCGVNAVEAFYILFMLQNFGMSPFYTGMQIGFTALIGVLVTAMMQSIQTKFNPYVVISVGSALTFVTAFGMYYLTANYQYFRITWMLLLCFSNAIGIVLSVVSSGVILVETSSMRFVTKNSLLMCVLYMTAGGIGPFFYSMTEINVFLFQCGMSFCSMVFFFAFVAVSTIMPKRVVEFVDVENQDTQ